MPPTRGRPPRTRGGKHFSSNSRRGGSSWPYARGFQERTSIQLKSDEPIESATPSEPEKQPETVPAPVVFQSTAPLKSVFEEEFEVDGILQYVELVYDRLRSWCTRPEVKITDLQLKYVTVVVCWARIACVRWMLHLGISEELKRLIDATKYVKLPSPLVQMVNALGSFKLANGCSIAPAAIGDTWVDSIQMLLTLGDRQIAPLLDVDWLADYNTRVSKSPLSGCTFVTANFEQPDGREEMVISYDDVNGRTVPYSPQATPQPIAELGGLYRFHQNLDWNAESLLRPNHEGKAFDPSVLFNKLMHTQEK